MTADQPLSDVAGVILAGGASSRFGANKALALFEGRPLIAHVAAKLEKLCAERLLVTNTPEIYQLLAWPMTGDRFDHAGPLAGIEAALRTIRAPRALILGCDMPLIDERLLSLLAHGDSAWDVILPWLPLGPEPLCAIYHRRALPAIEAALLRGERRIARVLARLRVKRLETDQLLAILPDFSSFHNINCPEDLVSLSLGKDLPGRKGCLPCKL